MNCEIERAAPLTPWERLGIAALVGFALVCSVAFCGCKTYYDNVGMRVRAGSVTSPVEVSEPTSSVNVRFLFFLDGVDLYASKGNAVEMRYYAANGGSWLSGATTQAVEVVVGPTNTCGMARTR